MLRVLIQKLAAQRIVALSGENNEVSSAKKVQLSYA